MLYFLGRRLVSSAAVLVLVSIISFLLIQAPEGDYSSTAKAFAIGQGGLSEAEAEALAESIRERYNLDQPIPVQYFRWIKGIFTEGDFGESFYFNRPVSVLMAERLPRTLLIATVSHLLATLIGVSLGIYAATQQHRLGDTVSTVLAFLGMTIPRFFMALVILYILAFIVRSPYIGSLYSPQFIFEPFSLAKLWDLFLHVWPVLFIAAFGGLAYNLRVMRGNLLDVLRQPYIEAARAKGLPYRRVVLKHAVPNALHPLVMYQGVILPYMLAGELEAAIILAIPTIGPLMLDSLNQQDLFVTSTILLILSTVLVIGNFLADVLLAVLDPRIRLAH